MKQFTIQYDTVIDGIRVVKLGLGAFKAVFTCNTRLGHCTARFEGKAAFSPDMQFINGRLCLSYPPTAIPPGSEQDFEDAWHEARSFARNYAGTVAFIINAIEQGEALA